MTTINDAQAAAILVSMRQPRIQYDSATKSLDISHHASFEQHYDRSEFTDDLIQSGFAHLGLTSVGVSIRTQTFHSDGYHQYSYRIRQNSRRRELHRIGATLKAIHDVKACAYSVGIMISLDDNGVLSWVLRRGCNALQYSHDVLYVRRRVRSLFELFEFVFRDYDMATTIQSQRNCRDAQRILRWVDRNGLDHATVLTRTGCTILIRLAGFESRCVLETFYGRPGNPKRPYTASSTERETNDGSDGSDGILHSQRSVY